MLCFLLLLLLFIFWERAWVSRAGAERERERERICTVRITHGAPTHKTARSWPEPKPRVGHSTDWATQVKKDPSPSSLPLQPQGYATCKSCPAQHLSRSLLPFHNIWGLILIANTLNLCLSWVCWSLAFCYTQCPLGHTSCLTNALICMNCRFQDCWIRPRVRMTVELEFWDCKSWKIWSTVGIELMILMGKETKAQKRSVVWPECVFASLGKAGNLSSFFSPWHPACEFSTVDDVVLLSALSRPPHAI